jgi:8-oxo-dGTP diphosphatase
MKTTDKSATSKEYPAIIVTVDVGLFTLKHEQLHVVVQVRDKGPFEGMPALIGGFFHANEDKGGFAAANRTLLEKTGLVAPYLDQLYTFSGPDRDPRGYSVSIGHFALVDVHVLERQNPKNILMFPVDELPQLAFDHNLQVKVAVDRIRGKAGYSTLPFYLLPEEFTITQLRKTYDQILGGKPENPSNFRRKIGQLDVIEEIDPPKYQTGVQRPAKLHRIRPDRRLAVFNRTI